MIDGAFTAAHGRATAQATALGDARKTAQEATFSVTVREEPRCQQTRKVAARGILRGPRRKSGTDASFPIFFNRFEP